MASRPTRWRILAVYDGVGVDDGQDARSLPIGVLQEFMDLAGSEAEVCVLSFANPHLACKRTPV